MVKVKFNDTAEFLQELVLQAGAYAVAPAVLRLTCRHRTAGGGAPYRRLYLVGTFLAGGQLFEVEDYAGEHWGEGFAETGAARARYQALRGLAEARAAELQLEVRAGVFEAPEVQPS